MSGADRTRFIHQWWDRAPGGKYLDKYDPPRGKRTPNGAVWGHSTDDLFMIQRIPGVNVVTCWSRSMIKEYGERPIDDGDEPDSPRIRRPYPLLKIDSDVECPERGMYDCFDEGSDHDDPIPVGDLEDKKARIEATVIELEEVVAEFEGADIVFEEADIEFEETDAEMRVDSPPQKPDQKYTHQEKHSDVHRCLEEHIPQQFFPDRLIVADASGLAFGNGKIPKKDGEPEREWIYERLYPSFPRDLSADRFAEDPVTAELYLDADEVVGVGHHSNVYRATLTLPKGLSARTPDGKVTVVAKTSFPRSQHRSLFHNEAKVFSSFPKHLSEEWCGYNVIPPLSWPVPVGAVVPKFYGYYVPTGERKDTLSPILLMEECGSPVNPPKLTPEQRTECHSLYLRFHAEGYIHQSTYIRNIVMQPGPLTRHPQERSLSTPSFRLIDFGRSINVEEKVAKVKLKEGLTEEEIGEERARAYRSWGMNRAQEEQAINKELGVGLEAVGSR